MNENTQCAPRGLTIHTANGPLYGQLQLATAAQASLIFVHTRNSAVDSLATANLVDYGYNVLSMDLLSDQEAQFADAAENIPRLTQRVIDLLDFARRDADLNQQAIGILATGNACPAALRATIRRDTQVQAITCHNGLIDRAGREALNLLRTPLLVLVESGDNSVEKSYERATPHLNTIHKFQSTEPSEDVQQTIASWFSRYLLGRP